MTSDQLTIPVFRRDEESAVVEAAAKHLIYLDSNIWIDIAEKCPQVAEQCRRAVRGGGVLFPVSNAAVAEVIEQPSLTQQACVASLMDELSEGISFRYTDDIQMLEADIAYEAVLKSAACSVDRNKVLCFVIERLGRCVLDFPSVWDKEDAEAFVGLNSMRPELRSVRWLVDHLPIDEMRVSHAKSKRKYVEKMTEAVARSARHFGCLPKEARRKRLLLEERLWVVKHKLTPRLTQRMLNAFGTRNTLKEIVDLLDKVGEGSEKRLEQVMKVMPSLDLQCKIMAEYTSNFSRRVREQDYCDVEHAIVGAAYADVFVTADGHLFDLLTKRCGVTSTHRCEIVRGIRGLAAVLTRQEGQVIQSK